MFKTLLLFMALCFAPAALAAPETDPDHDTFCEVDMHESPDAAQVVTLAPDAQGATTLELERMHGTPLKDRVLRCLAFGHARGVIDVVDRLAKARVTVTREQVEDALLELLEAGLVEVGGGRWQRV